MAQFKLERMNGIILEPHKNNLWESQAVFNPGAIRIGGEVHLLYRAVQNENFSCIGYAKMDRFGQVLARCQEPVIVPEWEIEKQGCEDPRIVNFEDKSLIFYTAYDGLHKQEGKNARVIMAETRDFQSIDKLGMVGPDCQEKDAMIFPEKIRGKVAFLHRIEPNIQLAYFDGLQHLLSPENGYWKKHSEKLDMHTILYRKYDWEALKIGTGPPPLRTEAGWLMIYHGVDKNRTYRAGAALLDENNPAKILARLPYPILSPEKDYEKYGDVNMVVFPEGLVLFEDELQVYYGAADKVIGLAKGRLSLLIEEFVHNKN
jgi:predicted GH43/DUF377 family glycosyl hydrolase